MAQAFYLVHIRSTHRYGHSKQRFPETAYSPAFMWCQNAYARYLLSHLNPTVYQPTQFRWVSISVYLITEQCAREQDTLAMLSLFGLTFVTHLSTPHVCYYIVLENTFVETAWERSGPWLPIPTCVTRVSTRSSQIGVLLRAWTPERERKIQRSRSCHRDEHSSTNVMCLQRIHFVH